MNGSIVKQTSVPVTVEACYGMTVSAPTNVQACAGDLYIPFTIESQGTQPQIVQFDVRANITTSIERSQAVLHPGRTLSEQVSIIVPNADRTYYATFAANGEYASNEATTIIKGYSTESCYLVAPTNHQFKVWTDQTVLPVVITHTGIQPSTYSVSYEGKFITPLEQQITLLPGEQAVVHLLVNSTGHETGRYVDRLMVSSHGVDYTTDFEIVLREKGAWQHFLDAWHWGGSFWICSIASIIALLLLGIIFVWALGIAFGFWTYQNPLWLTKQTVGWIAVISITILLLLMLGTVPSLTRSYERPIQQTSNSSLQYEMGENEEMQIDISQYFSDPDNDALSFSANQPEHLQVRITGDTALVRSAKGWGGEESLVFTASDGKGGFTDSALIQISVVPYKPVTFLQYWMQSCWFATWLLLLLAVVLFTLIVITSKDTHPKRPTKASGSDAQALIELEQPAHRLDHGSADTASLVQQPTTVNIGAQVRAENITINQNTPKEELWVASEEGTKFHRITCPIVRNMPAEKRRTFVSREDAIKAGYTPCKTCSSHE